MAALDKGRNTPQRYNSQFGTLQSLPVKTSSTLYVGGIVAVDNTGYAFPGPGTGAGTGVRAIIGVLDNQPGAVLPTASVAGPAGTSASPTGSVLVNVKIGQFHVDIDTAETPALNQADVGKLVFLVDDHTVSRASGPLGRPACGILREVTNGSSPQGTGAWVDLGLPNTVAPTGP